MTPGEWFLFVSFPLLLGGCVAWGTVYLGDRFLDWVWGEKPPGEHHG